MIAVLLAMLAQVDPTAQGIAEFAAGDYRTARVYLEKAPVSDARALAFLAMTRAALGECDAVAGELARAASSQDAAVRRLSGIAVAPVPHCSAAIRGSRQA
jgi:hypothetical protein